MNRGRILLELHEIDGHKFDTLLSTPRLNENNGKPKFILANTVKGKGIHFTENDNNGIIQYYKVKV